MFARVEQGRCVEIAVGAWIVDAQSVRHPPEVLARWPAPELAAIGVYAVVDDPIPEGKVSSGYALEFTGTEVRRHFTLIDRPPPPVPPVVSRVQAQAALLAAGRLAAVKAAMAQASAFDKLAWEEAAEFRRSSPTLNNLAAALGMTPADLDDLFRAAAQIEA